MPSAGRPFTPDIVTRLVAKGVGVTPVVLHTGVASLGAHERYPSGVKVPSYTAARVNATRQAKGRVIRLGTTVARAVGVQREPERPARGAGRVDRPGDHPRARGSRHRRAAHRVARARGLALARARGGRRPRPARALLRRQPGRGIPLARVRRHPSHSALSHRR